jgi:hypothetical protein
MSGSRQAGVDAACASGPEDDAPIEQATVEERVVLTEDRGPPRRLSPLPTARKVLTERGDRHFERVC